MRALKNIFRKGVKVKVNTTTFPDYIFGNNCKLKKLSEFEKFIKTKKHLHGKPKPKMWKQAA